MSKRIICAGWTALAVMLLCLYARTARAVDYNFAGSVSLNYKTLVNELANPGVERSLILSGFNVNAAVKAVVDVSPYLSATVKMCYGCHGLEAVNFYAEVTPHPAFNIRAGRIQPSFGDFYLRHDPTIHKTSDNPLPYDMGHMVHSREWGMGVVPVPYVDTGAEAYGTFRFVEGVSLSWSAHVVNGFKGPVGTAAIAQDFNYQRMRFVTTTDYLVDNNRWPAFGGRAALTVARGGRVSSFVPDITLGSSVMYGSYDDNDRLFYLIYGFDAFIHLWRVNLRAEVMRRQQQIDPRTSELADGAVIGSLNKNNMAAPTSYKDGFYLEGDFPLGRYLEGVLRWDGMRRSGARPSRTNPDQSPGTPFVASPEAVLDMEDWVLRYTAGLNIIPLSGVKIKLDYEFWNFKSVNDPYRDAHAAPFHNEYEVHVALVAGF